MNSVVDVVRRWWVVALAVIAVGIAGAMAALAASSEPTAAPPSPEAETPAAVATPRDEPSSGPTSTPEPGSLKVVPVGKVRTAAAVPFDETADFGGGLTLRVTALESVDGVARGPGEIAGPAVRMTLTLTNDGAEPVSLEGVVIAVSYGVDEAPAGELSGPGGRPFGGELAPGRTVTARYVFAIPADERDRVRAVASYTGSAPSVAFAGSVR